MMSNGPQNILRKGLAEMCECMVSSILFDQVERLLRLDASLSQAMFTLAMRFQHFDRQRGENFARVLDLQDRSGQMRREETGIGRRRDPSLGDNFRSAELFH